MPSCLRDRPFEVFYSHTDDPLHNLYIPALSCAVRYDRIAGYFSSGALVVAAAGVARLVENQGRMRLIVGAHLSEQDVQSLSTAQRSIDDLLRERLIAALEAPPSERWTQRLRILAWMAQSGTLELRVGLPAEEGLPVASEGYFHAKEGLFYDDDGHCLGFSGSINESARAWQHNYESLHVFASWRSEDARQHLARQAQEFERLWENRQPGWLTVPLPDAVRDALLRWAPPEAPPRWDPLEVRPEDSAVSRLLVQYVRDAPRLAGGGRNVALATAAVTAYPHQVQVYERVLDGFPESYLLADEVGLGKTIEAGLVLRQWVISGRMRRVLLLVPKSVHRQWMEELHEKFALDIPFYDGHQFTFLDGRSAPILRDGWSDYPMMLASSQLAKRREREDELLAADDWDLVLVDEAHHARRRDFLDTRQYRPNRLLTLLEGLRSKTRVMLLLTATPMQVHPIEVWDLLRLLGLSGLWGAHEERFVGFFRALRAQPRHVNWDVVLPMVRDHLHSGGTINPQQESLAQSELGMVHWSGLRRYLSGDTDRFDASRLSDEHLNRLEIFCRRHTPLAHYVFRNTRGLLRRYYERGLLDDNVPNRSPHLEVIQMTPEEHALYDRLDEYISEYYQRLEQERKGLGFIMTVYRRRLTSSLYAIRCSLEKRLAGLREGDVRLGRLVDEEDVEDEDLSSDVLTDIPDEHPLGGHERQREIEYLERFIGDLSRLGGTDSKLEYLKGQLLGIFDRHRTVLVFTQYTDTMDYLREGLLPVYGRQVACYSGRGGERWEDGRWIPETKETIKNLFRAGEEIKIMLCTEAASEGLNLQTCGALINYDMPWNPMRVEQRIGRIDRIGQVYAYVDIHNYFYRDTVEELVYQALSDRISWFESVVGTLQPILVDVERVIRDLAMRPRSEREQAWRRAEQDLRQRMADEDAATLDLDGFADEALRDQRPAAPVTTDDLERVLLRTPEVSGRLRPDGDADGVFRLQTATGRRRVTFSRTVAEEHPDTVTFLTYGTKVLDDMIRLVPTPDEGAGRRGILRLRTQLPVPVCAYFAPDGADAKEIGSIADLEGVLVQPPAAWSNAQVVGARRAFKDVLDNLRVRLDTYEQRHRQTREREMRARGKECLVRAADLEYLPRLRQLAAEGGPALGHRLPRPLVHEVLQGYPWAPLLRLLGESGLYTTPPQEVLDQRPMPSDAQQIQELVHLRQRAERILRDLAAAPDGESGPATVGEVEEAWFGWGQAGRG